MEEKAQKAGELWVRAERKSSGLPAG